MFCKCGAEIPAKRVEFLQKAGKPLTCIAHSSTQKVGGFMASEGKTERTIIIAEMDVIEDLHKKSARVGVGVSRGVKMNQSFQPKIFK
jgi:hypothetical protein